MALLITQCLQKDFVKPLGKYDSLPNQLHVGYDEARRLMGDITDEGPTALMMKWAYAQPEHTLSIIHIRDWHDPESEQEHFRQFGPHCIKDSDGAQFAFPISAPQRAVTIINSQSLNDFNRSESNQPTPLEQSLANPVGKTGIMGVWTEAKVFFLAYDLRTRFPQMDIAVCSALTASSSRTRHFMFLDQMQRILGVKVFSSVGEFINFLSDTPQQVSIPVPSHSDRPTLLWEQPCSPSDALLVKYLFRDCSQVRLKSLTGGFSGNLVLAAESSDLFGHKQVPHVLKIGPQGPIGRERQAFEQIEEVLGNHAPRITDFVDDGHRGALKYRYASMGGGFSTTFKQFYAAGAATDKIKQVLSTVFLQQLGRLYSAAQLEQVNLLEYYEFLPKYGPSVQRRIDALYGSATSEATLSLPTGKVFPNPALFYSRSLPALLATTAGSSYVSFVHGDLNGANIIIDSQENVWLIDFFHTQPGHVLKDLIKLENDLLYIFTPLDQESHLEEAVRITDILLDIKDLARPLPPLSQTGLRLPQMCRAYETVRLLRSFYPALIRHDRSPIQLLIGQLRYAAHTLSFDESNHLQKFWALYTAGRISTLLTERIQESGPLRLDRLDKTVTAPGSIGLTLMPGRKDYNRSLTEDISILKHEGVQLIISLVTKDELETYGVTDLPDSFKKAGFDVVHLPIKDQAVSTPEEMYALVTIMDTAVKAGKNIMIHCVGGLGRSGLVAASFLIYRGLDPKAAIAEVRRVRSPRAVESLVQESFTAQFADFLKHPPPVVPEG